METASTAEMHSVLNRLKRAQGQRGGVVRMVDEGRDDELRRLLLSLA